MRLALLLLLSLATLTLQAAAPRFSKALLIEGMQIKMPARCEGKALKTEEMFKYTQTIGTQSSTIECYDPHDLWYRRQHLGAWQDRDGNGYRLAKMESLPGAFPPDRKHITKAEFEIAQKAAPTLDHTQWASWLTAFLDIDPGDPLPGFKGNPSMRGLKAYATEDVLVFVFEFKAYPGTVFVFEMAPLSRQDLKTLIKTSRTTFIPSLTWRGQKKQLGKPGAKGKFRPHPTRDGAKKSIANSTNWFAIDAPDYVLISDLPKNNRNMGQKLLNELQVIRQAYTELFPLTPTSVNPVSVVRIFASPDDYLNYVGKEAEWSAGLYSPRHKELVLKNDDTLSANDRKDRLQLIIYHEGFHQFLDALLDGKNVPIWFNEGHATYFEAADVSTTAKRVRIPVNTMRLETIKRMNSYPIKSLMLMDTQTFYDAKSTTKLNANYALAWGITYFLRTAQKSRSPLAKPYATFANDYFAAITAKDLTPQQAFDALFKSKYDFAKFEQAVTKFLDRLAKK